MNLNKNKIHLVLDIGNTSTKYYIFFNDEIIEKNKIKTTLKYGLKKIAKKYTVIDGILYSSVKKSDFSIIPTIFANSLILDFKKAKYPFNNLYKTPNTLGQDRIGLMAAATLNYPKENVLVIDVGTCITYDFMDSQSNYRGGAISPGLKMRYKSLEQFTSNLPLVSILKKKENNIGENTEESIQVGVFNNVLHEINGQIKSYLKKYDALKIILTGGDSKKIEKYVKNTIHYPDFLAHGLNYILKMNKS